MPAVPHCTSFLLSGRRQLHGLKMLAVSATLLGLLGQLALQSVARPDEVPRMTLERLTGLQIGPKTIPRDRHMTMPGMSMAADRHHTTNDHQHSHHDEARAFCVRCSICPASCWQRRSSRCWWPFALFAHDTFCHLRKRHLMSLGSGCRPQPGHPWRSEPSSSPDNRTGCLPTEDTHTLRRAVSLAPR